MIPGKRLPAEGEKKPSDATEGSASLKSVEEILPEGDPAWRGNSVSTDLISTQPLPAADLPAGVIRQPQHDLQKPTCPQCGPTAQDHRLNPVSQSLNRLQSSKSSVQSSSRSKASHQPAAAPTDSCFHLLLACLWCQCSVLLLGLLEACSSSLQCLCSPCCCRACARCCSEVQETPLEELNCHAHCHSVLFESCCESVECLEFCLDCCEICHRN